MSQIIPQSLQSLIDAFCKLPGVGSRTAERYAYTLLQRDQSVSKDLARHLDGLHKGIKRCPVTFALINSEDQVSPLYSSPNRDKTLIAVVADPFDIVALEKTSSYHGTYHVLGGLISPIDGVSPEELHIPELIQRVKQDKVKEVILATNASVEGESTALYIQQQLRGSNVIISRLARGLPVGVDLEYTDQITLERALEGRTLL
jgi:recombination protein RecR